MGVGGNGKRKYKKANLRFAFDSVTVLILAKPTVEPMTTYLQFDGGC